MREFRFSDDDEQEPDEPAGFSGRNLADVSPVEHMLQDLQLRWQNAVQVGPMHGLAHADGACTRVHTARMVHPASCRQSAECGSLRT